MENNFNEIIELAKLKRENPEKYREYLDSLKTVFKDIAEMIVEIKQETKKKSSVSDAYFYEKIQI